MQWDLLDKRLVSNKIQHTITQLTSILLSFPKINNTIDIENSGVFGNIVLYFLEIHMGKKVCENTYNVV